MTEDKINNIGFKQSKRKDARLADINKVQGLTKILDQDFESWSNFDTWGNMVCQQWIFTRAMDVYKGKKVDIRCGCCEYVKGLPDDMKSKSMGKDCYGTKTAYMVYKVLDEIKEAKKVRDSDGTYTA
tara:strand:- start:149 stop:529 length:381 start_codon:yes stop_codon:yes gene_type:complete